ncbi:type IV secretion protein Dot [Legionella sp. km772]|uniref:type IV secretion protein Dot n=1 Tax=Legionella sp. km772 TaxID=2498111 RepID=UPI000F8E68CE|nr:type IV secretion protein Dot [Legionella sp. km772]RUR11672.1 type IV secretion protein Dot [Legionella sp. km772]
MTNYNEELKTLSDNGLLPDNHYLAAKRFTRPYSNQGEFYYGIATIAYVPIVNGLSACVYAMRAVWATMRALGNLLILKPGYTVDAVRDAGFHSLLTIGLAVMAPINALTSSLELLTRTIASWFSGEEPIADLSPLSFSARSAQESEQYKTLLPSSSYFKGSRFFTPYQDALQCLGQLAAPVASGVSSGFSSLYQAAHAISAAINGLSNLVICKPRHALENVRDCSIHASLALSLAVMAPINALVEGLAFISRLGATWLSACIQPEVENATATNFRLG